MGAPLQVTSMISVLCTGPHHIPSDVFLQFFYPSQIHAQVLLSMPDQLLRLPALSPCINIPCYAAHPTMACIIQDCAPL
jgi:hypothetical protein